MFLPAELWTIAKSEQGSLILIRPVGSDVAVPISIDPWQTHSILIGLGNVKVSRPLTHDLFISTLAQLNINIKKIEITELKEGIFYARLILEQEGQEYIVDSRPSDCLALAVRVKCPIFIEEKVVKQENISVNLIDQAREQNKEEVELEVLKKKLDHAVEEENYEEAAAIRDKIEQLEKKEKSEQ